MGVNVADGTRAEESNGGVLLVGTEMTVDGTETPGQAASSSITAPPTVTESAGIFSALFGRQAPDSASVRENVTEPARMAPVGAEPSGGPASSDRTPERSQGPVADPQPGVDADSTITGATAGDALVQSPRSSDLLTDFLPLDRASLESAVDRFLGQFESLGSEFMSSPPPKGLIPLFSAIAITALASEVARQRWSQSNSLNAPPEDDEEGLLPFSGHPSLWSLRET
jgi:hypothetical protein